MNLSQLPEGLSLIPITEWENRHQNFKVDLVPNASFNMRLPFAFTEHVKNYHATTKNFQWLIQHAIDTGLRLRALGGGWSFSDVAVADGLVDTRELRAFFSFGASFLNQAYLDKGNKPQNLILTQCGMSMLQLSRELEKENGWMQSLKASGASNGQTIVGAAATGTHGSAYQVGAVHDTIVGMHIITGPDKHVWVEKESNPVASDAFIDWLGAEKISNDDIFNSAVVSFGSFGFVHSVLLETEPIFLLEKRHKGNIPYTDDLKAAINTLDFTKIEAFLPYPLGEPNPPIYHFEIVANPHNLEADNPEKGVFFRIMYKMPYKENYPKEVENNKYQYGDDLLGIVQKVLDGLGNTLQLLVVPKLVGALLPQAFDANSRSQGTIGETFGNTKVRGQAASAAIGIDSSHASLAIDEIVKINKQIPFAGALALRFVKGTKAILGFTHFPITCILEMDGVDSASSRKFFQAIWERLEELDVPYTLHWGKINFILNGERVRKMYGTENVNKWIDSREKLLDEPTRKVFTNDFLVRNGLDKK